MSIDPKEVARLELLKFYNQDIDKLKYPEIVAGDTDSFFIELQKYIDDELSPEEKLDAAEKLGNKILEEEINKKLLREFLPDLLNWNKDQIHLDLEYEALGRAYFLAKKKYAYYIQKPEEKLLIKGLETERSDYPRLTREVLHRVLEMLLIEQKPLPEIYDFIEEKRQEFIELIKEFDTRIGKPVSWAKSNYKKVPSHVIGMLLYNEIAGTEFKVGSKGYAFRIKVIKTKCTKLYEKLINIVQKYSKKKTIDWIVIPSTEASKKLPDCIIPDVDAMIKFVLDDRISLLLSEIKQRISSFEELF